VEGIFIRPSRLFIEAAGNIPTFIQIEDSDTGDVIAIETAPEQEVRLDRGVVCAGQAYGDAHSDDSNLSPIAESPGKPGVSRYQSWSPEVVRPVTEP
jgi:hypothetical protein